MSRCFECNKWFIVGEEKVLGSSGQIKHAKCPTTQAKPQTSNEAIRRPPLLSESHQYIKDTGYDSTGQPASLGPSDSKRSVKPAPLTAKGTSNGTSESASVLSRTPSSLYKPGKLSSTATKNSKSASFGTYTCSKLSPGSTKSISSSSAMPKCYVCNKWFIVGEEKVLGSSGQIKHAKCPTTQAKSQTMNSGGVEHISCPAQHWTNRGSSPIPDNSEEKASSLPSVSSAVGSETDTKCSTIQTDVADFTCSICCDDISGSDVNMVAADCTPHCNSCFAQWIETQVRDGNAIKLRCPCGQHNLQYSHFRKLQNFMSDDVKTIFDNAHRQSTTRSHESEITCPECNSVTVIYENQVSYLCLAANCPLGGTRNICCKHNTYHSRPRNASTGSVDVYGQERCSACVAEADGNIAVADILSCVLDALNDRCPSCGGYVGEPEDFGACMALKCSHCPNAFCGYCYKFSGNWRDAHDHARHCSKNPRVNYYVESEAVWRGLMACRKLEIVETVLATTELTEDAKELVRERVRPYIL